MKRYIPLLFLLLHTTLHAQDTQNSGAVWTDVGITKVLPYNLSVDADFGFRSFDWFNHANRFDVSLGVNYKLGKYFKFGLSYTFIERHYLEETKMNYGNSSGRFNGYNIDAAHWTPRHRVSFDVTADKRFWKTLRISLRERYQFTHQSERDVNRTRLRAASYDAEGNITDWEDPEEVIKQKSAWDRHLLRSRLKFAIDRKGWKWEPFASVETHNNMSDGWHLDKIRSTAGTEFSISSQHKVSAAYVFTHENDDDGNENIHAINIGYHFKF